MCFPTLLKIFAMVFTDYRMVIVCSKDGNTNSSPMISRLQLYERFNKPSFTDEECKQYVMSHFIHDKEESTATLYASSVDLQK